MELRDGTRRQHERFRLGGIARLVVDHPGGLITAMGHLIDLSEGGCQLRVSHRVDPYLAARVRIEVAGDTLWMPVVTRWVRGDTDGWMVGCAFDRPTLEKQLAVHALLETRTPLSV